VNEPLKFTPPLNKGLSFKVKMGSTKVVEKFETVKNAGKKKTGVSVQIISDALDNGTMGFAVKDDGCTGKTLTVGGPGSSCKVGVTFVPTDKGKTHTANLVFIDNDSQGGGMQKVPLSGVGK
jgi:hypothetical protein